MSSFRLTAITLVLGLLASLFGGPVYGLSDELRCRDAIAIQSRNFFKSRYTAIAKCEDGQSLGKIGAAVNCRPADGVVTDAKTLEKLQKAETKLTDKLADKCTDAIVNPSLFGLPCGSAASVAEITSCIVGDAHAHDADLLVDTVYDDNGELTFLCSGGDNDGLPCDPNADLATECPNGGTTCRDVKSLRLCQKAISTASRNYAKDRMTIRRSCGKKLEDGKIQGPCPDDKARIKLEKSLAKFRKKVLKKCTDVEASDAALAFGFPCDGFLLVTFERDGATNNNQIAPAERLVRCLANAAAGDGDLGNETAYPLFDAAPFSYGVAAGDATDTAFIAWTRTDGPGGVTLEVATNEDFSSIVYTDAALTPDPAADNAVKTDVTGLSGATQYYYRFTQSGSVSRTGAIKTAPAVGSTAPVRFVWTGDSNAFFRPFTVLDGILEDDPDLWLYIGDTIYGDDPRSGTGVATVRSEYHTKYKENRNDASLRNTLASFGTLTIWDDHEVTNDFYGTDPSIATQMAEGNQAMRDYLPIREDGGDAMRLYRSFRWGDIAEFFLIDARQYRDAQAYITEPACLDMGAPVTLPNPTCQLEINNPSRTYLGAAQKAWLKAALLGSGATYKFVMNGPLISALTFLPFDRWEGYAAERTEILEYIEANNIKNVVFLSTDIHALIVNGGVVNPGGSGGSTPEWVSGAIGMDPIFRELPASIAPFVPSLPALFSTVTHFDIDRFNYGLVEVSTTEAKLSYRDNTGAVIHEVTLPVEP